MALAVTSLAGCPPTITLPSTVCNEPTRLPNCQDIDNNLDCCNSWSSFASWEYACVSSNVPCFKATDATYSDLCKTVTGLGSATPITGTKAPAAATASTTTTIAGATSPAPTKSSAVRYGGAGRSISAVAIVVGAFVFLMA